MSTVVGIHLYAPMTQHLLVGCYRVCQENWTIATLQIAVSDSVGKAHLEVAGSQAHHFESTFCVSGQQPG